MKRIGMAFVEPPKNRNSYTPPSGKKVEKTKKLKEKTKSKRKETKDLKLKNTDLVKIKEVPPAHAAVKKKRGRPKNMEKKSKELGKIAGVFGVDGRKIQALLKNNNDDAAILKMQRSLLNMLVEMIPIAEETYRTHKTERAAYAMNAFISQIRELMSDIVSSQDRQIAAETIVNSIIKPAMLGFAQFTIDNNYQLSKKLSAFVADNKVQEVNSIINSSTKNVGVYMQSLMEDFSTQIRKTLNE